jgi:hypothetical protein
MYPGMVLEYIKWCEKEEVVYPRFVLEYMSSGKKGKACIPLTGSAVHTFIQVKP